MIDFARITVKAGDGGRGAGSFAQIKGKRYGKADGGDGGSGGNVYIEASDDLNTLEQYRYVKDYKAQDGQHGLSNRRRGANGEDLVLKVPVGTLVKVSESVSQWSGESVNQKTSESVNWKSETPSDRITEYDLVEDGQKILIARGDEGGRGNAKLRDEFGRRPRIGEVGQKGEVSQLTLELKLIADVGLIGLPNAGKSTLLARLTAARPAIAAYPFTTLEPNLGVMSGPRAQDLESSKEDLDASSLVTRRLVIADIPGLIEGASHGRGLGDLFLRHIERTKILVHLVDASTKGDIWQSYQTIRSELKLYSSELAGKKEIIVLNKIDLVDQGQLLVIKEMFAKHRKKVIPISAKEKMGLDFLIKAMSHVRVEP